MRVVRMQCLGMVMLAAFGCAHTREPYSYLPPLAPPVYPQPQEPPRPVVQPAALPQPAGSPVAMLPGPVTGGVVPAGGDPCCQPAACDGAVPVVYESAAAVPCCP